ncbi:MAG: PadR family transcriptional regulator [bacterium]|nr:PadR family transcriptional regulator [bacterium]
MKYLTLNEEVLLLAILRLKDNAYPVSIREKVIEMTKKDVVYGTLYNSLDHLQKKGYISSEKGDPTPERGGKSKIYFNLTVSGLTTLKNTIEFHESIWKGVEELSANLKKN